jgi:glycosyltransferase involved in cell wall biosynthesis
MNEPLITILIPSFNESKTILKVLNRISEIFKNSSFYEIIIIDDGSTDNTKKLLDKNKNLYTNLITYGSNRGKGYAIKKGLEKAKGKYIFFQDADLEYDPIELNKFIKLINLFNPDLIIGSRFNYSEYSRSHNFFNKVGNKVITLIFNLLYNTTFTDIYSCYVCFKRELLNEKNLKTNGFEQHAEIICNIVKKGKNFYELPISYNGRTIEEGKKIKFYHAASVIFRIICERF